MTTQEKVENAKKRINELEQLIKLWTKDEIDRVFKKDTLEGIVYSVRQDKTGKIYTGVQEHLLRRPLEQEVYDCKTYEDLKALAAKRGYKQGWAYYRWQQRQNKRFY